MRFLILTVPVVLVAGCQESRGVSAGSAYEALSKISIMGKGKKAALVFPTEKMLGRFIDMQVDRLGGASWQEAWLNLRRAGRFAVEPLVAALDDDRPAMATVTALPGIVTPGDRIFLTRREVAYALLREIVGDYSTYRGAIPPLDRKAWEKWWRANGRRVEIRTEAVVSG